MLNLSSRLAAGALVLTLTVAGTGLRLAAAVGLPGETATETRSTALPLAGKLVVAGRATINGKKALSGSTIFSENRIAVANTVGNAATITLGRLGRVDMQPGTELVLRFADGFIGGELLAGHAVIRNLAGVKVALKTPAGVVTEDEPDPAQQGDSPKLEKVLTPQEMMEQAAAIVKSSQQVAAQANKMLDGARREKDIMQANCLNSKLTEINALARNAQGRQKDLAEAVAAKDQVKMNDEFNVLKVLRAKLASLDQEMSQCVGQDTSDTGKSEVKTEIPSDSSDFGFTDVLTVVIPPVIPLVVIPIIACNR
jgi:hypothetical protein